MSAVFIAFLLTALVSIAGREQVRAARLAAARGDGMAVLALGAISIVLTTALAAWLGTAMAPLLQSAAARWMFVAFAIGFAAFEVALLRAPKAPEEPTRSLGALCIVLLAAHATDAARFAVLALAVATGQPVLVAAGGIVGSLAALALAVATGAAWERRVPVRALAIGTALVLLVAAFAVALWARST